MVLFAGYVPVQYEGVTIEQNSGNELVLMFHMGEFILKGEKALELIQKFSSNDASKLFNGKAQYIAYRMEMAALLTI